MIDGGSADDATLARHLLADRLLGAGDTGRAAELYAEVLPVATEANRRCRCMPTSGSPC